MTIEIDEDRDSFYNEILELYLEIVGAEQHHLYFDRLKTLLDYYDRGKILTRIRAVEAILEIFNSLIEHYGRLKDEYNDWEIYERTNKGEPVDSKFSSSAEVKEEMMNVFDKIDIYIDTIKTIVKEEKNGKVMNGIDIFVATRKSEHKFILDNKFEMIEDLYDDIENHPLL